MRVDSEIAGKLGGREGFLCILCSNSKVLEWLFRLIIAGYFIWAAVPKIIAPHEFLANIRAYELLPDPFNGLLAYFLPFFELLAALLLIFGRIYARAALLAIVGMLAIFLFGLIQAKLRGLDIKCGCFGDSKSGNSLGTQIFIDFVLLGMCIWLGKLFFRNRTECKSAESS